MNQTLESIIQELIERYDKTRVIETDDGLKKVHPGEKGYDSARYRRPNEMTIMKLTRKLFFPDKKYQEPDLSDEEKNALILWTMERKEKGAAILSVLKEYLRLKFFNGEECYETGAIPTELDFLDKLTLDVLEVGNKLIRDKTIEITTEGGKAKYSAKELLEEWISFIKTKRTKFSHFNALRDEAQNVPYLMYGIYRKSIPNTNQPYMVFTRVKHSDSANEKLAQLWGMELDLLKKLEPYLENPSISRGYCNANTLAEKLRNKDPKNPAFKRYAKANNIKPNRIKELEAGFFYDMEDLFGLTIVFSHEYNQKYVDRLISFFSNPSSLFIYEKDSLDLHINDPSKPDEIQFRVRINKKILENLVGEKYANSIYIPEIIEIQVISMPDLVLKHLAPYLGERAYKEREKRKRTKGKARTFYESILDKLKSISPSKALESTEGEHEEQIRRNLRNPTNQKGYEVIKKLYESLCVLFKNRYN